MRVPNEPQDPESPLGPKVPLVRGREGIGIPPRICAVVPVFNPDGDLADRLRRVQAQVTETIVVDDGSTQPDTWSSGLRELPGVRVLRQRNAGIAAAINHGITASDALDRFDYVLSVDQDSRLAHDYLARAIAALQLAESKGISVGAVCAEQFNDWKVSARRTLADGLYETMEVAQSGLLVPAHRLRQVGLFDSTLFIDGVDTDYAFRLRKRGLAVLVGNGCRMTHEVGQLIYPTIGGRRVRAFGRTLRYSYHGPARRYYITRNRITLWRRYFWLDPWWSVQDTFAELRTTLLALVFGPSRRPQIRAVRVGVLDGLAGVSGPIPPRVEAALRSRGSDA